MSDKYENYRKLLRERLDDYRYIHSLNVADSARHLAEKYGGDPEKAYEAGLLHDIMKNAGAQETFTAAEKYGIAMTPLERTNRKLWHAITGAGYARHELGITDENMLNAIRYHTTGRAGMSLLEKIIFTADFISAERDYDGVDRMREKAEISLECAMKEGLQFTILELCRDMKCIHPDTIDAYNDILMKGNE